MFPNLFHIGSFGVPSYGLLVASGFLAGIWLTTRLAKRAGLNHDSIVNLAVYCALAGIAGAKLMMIALDPELRAHITEIFTLSTLQSAGIFYGGFVGALIAAYVVIRREHLPLLTTTDVFAPGIALGHGIGRLGCFAAGCCWGRETSLPWAVTFTNPQATTGVPLHRPLHPTQLYESLGEWIITAILLLVIHRRHAEGRVFGLYLVLYGLLRFVVEFFRVHDQSNPLGLSISLEQWIALALGVVGAVLLLRKTGNFNPEPVRA